MRGQVRWFRGNEEMSEAIANWSRPVSPARPPVPGCPRARAAGLHGG